ESDPNAAALVVGPYAFFSALPNYTGRERKLVPVMQAWNDVTYSLDTRGRGWTCATMVEGVSRLAAPDGRALVTQAILWRALETHPRSYIHREGLWGMPLAVERGVGPIEGASGETERWWGDGDRLVVEIDRGNGFQKPMTFATL